MYTYTDNPICVYRDVYMYIILKHNPKLKVGKMLIHHVIFDEDETLPVTVKSPDVALSLTS